MDLWRKLMENIPALKMTRTGMPSVAMMYVWAAPANPRFFTITRHCYFFGMEEKVSQKCDPHHSIHPLE